MELAIKSLAKYTNNESLYPGLNQPRAKLAVLIVSYNVAPYLSRCLESVSKYLNSLDYLISIVDNASSDNSAEIALLRAQHGNILLTKAAENMGFGRGINLAASQIDAEYYLILNPDTEIISPICSEMLNVLETSKEISVVGCPMLDKTGNIQPFPYRLPSTKIVLAQLFGLKLFLRMPGLKQLFRSFRQIPDFKGYLEGFLLDGALKEVKAVPGSGFVIRASAFKALQGFDPNIFLYMEDCDLFRRLSDTNHQVRLLCTTGIVHLVGKSFSKKFTQISPVKLWSTLYYFKKHMPLRDYVLIRLALLITTMCKTIFIGIPRLDRSYICDGLYTLKICILGQKSFNPFSRAS